MLKNSLDQFHILVQQLLSQYKTVQLAVDNFYALRESASKNEMLEPVKKLLVNVKQTEEQIRPIRDALKEDGVTIPASTQLIIEETVRIVTTLIPRIGALEKEAIESRESLAPVIREGIRAVKMKNAYAKQQT